MHTKLEAPLMLVTPLTGLVLHTLTSYVSVTKDRPTAFSIPLVGMELADSVRRARLSA
ncbi:hypothetical protein B0H10DRAFT_2238331 [Mycena sp. CBHHK59/15]|nr:hypothetical protein B0H10DRAFT_2238331 [Mycena sp. CBHHK59/15]